MKLCIGVAGWSAMVKRSAVAIEDGEDINLTQDKNCIIEPVVPLRRSL